MDGTVTPSCSPSAGGTFTVGPNTVTCTATDAHSNAASQSFTVTITDTTDPTIGAPPADLTREATDPGGAAVADSAAFAAACRRAGRAVTRIAGNGAPAR